jgi:hypothetical protein
MSLQITRIKEVSPAREPSIPGGHWWMERQNVHGPRVRDYLDELARWWGRSYVGGETPPSHPSYHPWAYAFYWAGEHHRNLVRIGMRAEHGGMR